MPGNRVTPDLLLCGTAAMLQSREGFEHLSSAVLPATVLQQGKKDEHLSLKGLAVQAHALLG